MHEDERAMQLCDDNCDDEIRLNAVASLARRTREEYRGEARALARYARWLRIGDRRKSPGAVHLSQVIGRAATMIAEMSITGK